MPGLLDGFDPPAPTALAPPGPTLPAGDAKEDTAVACVMPGGSSPDSPDPDDPLDCPPAGGTLLPPPPLSVTFDDRGALRPRVGSTPPR